MILGLRISVSMPLSKSVATNLIMQADLNNDGKITIYASFLYFYFVLMYTIPV
jgi:hypothetical protein